MKAIYIPILFIAVLIFGSCNNTEKEETKASLNEETQNKLDQMEEEWSQLTSDIAQWSKEFSTEMAEWKSSRPMDSIKYAVENNVQFAEILGNSWQELYEEAVARGEDAEAWENEMMMDFKRLNKEATDFSDWKNKVEAGEVDEKEIEKGLKNHGEKLEGGKNYLIELNSKWENFRDADLAAIDAFRVLFK